MTRQLLREMFLYSDNTYEEKLPTAPPVEVPVPPAGWVFARVLHDDETHEKNRLGLPETFDMFDSHFVPLNEAWQLFLFNLMWRKVPSWVRSQVVTAWASLTKDGLAFTDHNAVQNGRADYIQKLNLSAGPIAWKTLVTGGNTICIKSETVSKGGEACHQILTLNGTLPPPSIDSNLTGLVGVATTRSAETLADGRHLVNPFPQLSNADVPALIISNRTNYIRSRHITTVGPFFHPYVP